MSLAVVVVDPISTGLDVAEQAAERDYSVIRLWSDECPEELRSHLSRMPKEGTFAMTLQHDGSSDEASLSVTADILRSLPYKIVAVICGADTGVTLSNALSAHMGLRSNDPALANVRANKYFQSEAVRASGHRAVEQVLASCEEEVEEFLGRYAPVPFRIIVKPVNSAGSDDVKLCRSAEEVLAHFRLILSRETNAVGKKNESALIQEYLAGTEYVVNFVSRDGVHKCVDVWEYDKRPANGGPAVYFGEWPMGGESPLAQKLIKYTEHVLDAVGIANGSTHSEVIVCADGNPCLVECNCRTAGGGGQWLPVAQALYGYTQVSVLLDAYLNASAFDAIPTVPLPLTRYGCVGHIVSYQQGKLLGAPGLQQMESLPSYVHGDLSVHVGDVLVKTVDFLTDAGYFLLIHDDRDVVRRDYEKAQQLAAHTTFFSVEADTAPCANENQAAISTGCFAFFLSWLSGRALQGAGAEVAQAAAPEDVEGSTTSRDCDKSETGSTASSSEGAAVAA